MIPMPNPQRIAEKLLDILRREEAAILTGCWEKLAPLDRLRAKLWGALGANPTQEVPLGLVENLRDQSEKNTRLFADALAEVGEKLTLARRHSKASAAYSQEMTKE